MQIGDKLKLFSEYSGHKANMCFTKKIVLGIIGGFFIGLGCAAFLRIYCANGIEGQNFVGLFLGSFVFATGFVMCVIFGGNIYTSNVAEFQSVLEKKLKWRHFFTDLAIVTVANYIGGILIALICWGMGMFGTLELESTTSIALAVFTFCEHKINLAEVNSIWKNLLSSTVTNILIIVALIMFITYDKKVIGFAAMLMAIIIFVIGGYQHIVADFFFTTLGLLIGHNNPEITGLVWKTFAYCLIPTAVGNLLGGMIVVYAFNILNKTFENRPTTTKSTKSVQKKPVA